MGQYLYLSVYLVCAYDALVMLLLPSSATFFSPSDGAVARLAVNMLAITIGLAAIFFEGIKRLDNKWLLMLIGFMVFSAAHSPNVKFGTQFLPNDNGIYNYKPMFEAMVFMLMFMGIYSIKITGEGFNKICNAISWVGIIYAAYAVFQRLGVDQLYMRELDEAISSLSRNWEAGGLISQPVFAGALMVIASPFIFKTKSIWKISLILAGILVTGNRTAVLAATVACLYSSRFTRTIGIYASLTFILALILATLYSCLNQGWQPDERLLVWRNTIIDFFHPAFPGIHKCYILTGLGIGSYSVFYPFYHLSGFYQAHNEFLEVFYCLSLTGLFLFIMSIKSVFSHINDACLRASLLGIGICAMTNPVWHNPQLQFLTVLIAGIGLNMANKKESYVLESRR